MRSGSFPGTPAARWLAVPAPRRRLLPRRLVFRRSAPFRAAAVCLLILLRCPPAWALELGEAVRLGLSLHPAVAAAEAELAAAGVDVAIARDGYWPTVQISAGPENALRDGLGYEVSARQMLYDWGRTRARVEEASAVEREQLEAFKIASDKAALDIIEVYLDVLVYEARLAAVDRHLERLGGLAALAADRAEFGYADRGEAERAALELARAREQRAVEAGALAEARSQFHELLQRPSEGLGWPAPAALAERLRPAEALEAAVAEAPLLRQAEAKVAAAHAEREATRAALKPQLNLEGALLRREIGGEMEEDAIVAVRVRLDPFQGRSNLRRVDAAARRVEAARWNQGEARRTLRRELMAWVEQAEVLGWRLESLALQLASAHEAAAAYREQFEVGLRGIDDLLPIQRDLFDTDRQRIDLETQKMRLQYRIASRLGRLDEVLPATGYDRVRGAEDGA